MDFFDPFIDAEPSTSTVDFSIPAVHSVNLTNLTLNGAKIFNDPADKSRFMSEFGRLQVQNPNWSPIRLIRERLQIQMRIQDENLVKRREQKNKTSANNTPKLKRKQKAPSDSEQEDEEEKQEYSALNRLINSVNEQIGNSRFIELDESKTVCAQADSVLLIDAGDGKCVLLDCQELLEMHKNDLHSIDDIRWLNASRTSGTNGRETNAGTRPKRKRITTPVSVDSSPVVTRSGRIKHACQHCQRTFTNTNSFVEHMKEKHAFEELGEQLDIKPDKEFLNSIIKNGHVP